MTTIPPRNTQDNPKRNIDTAGCLFILISAPLIVVVGTVINGFLLSTVWGWFMVPFGLPAIGKAWACGIVLIAEMLTNSEYKEPIKPKEDDTVYSLIGQGCYRMIMRALVILLCGYIFHYLMPVQPVPVKQAETEQRVEE